MGQGGRIVLVNGTPFTWTCVSQSSYQMSSWNFKKAAQTIEPGTVASVYVEWKEGAFNNEKDDAADARYVLEGTPYSFSVQARASSAPIGVTRNLRIYFPDVSVYNFSEGGILNLGWNWNGQVNFVLTGDSEPNFSSNVQPTNWMQYYLPTLGNKTLRELCIPGSHDAGMSVINGKTAFIAENNVLTQTKSINEQLKLGSRYFDIRPTISGGNFFTGHYSDIPQLNSWQGANGESIIQIINEINDFTANNKELIVLNLSHDYDTDIGNENYTPFTQTQWNNLFQLLLTINYRFILPNAVTPALDPTTVDLTTLQLSNFIGNNQAAVLIIFQPNDSTKSLGDYHLKGFYNYSQFSAYNSYSNSSDTGTMVSDQLAKLQKLRPNPYNSYFLLSWTLTQNGGQAVGSLIDPNASIVAFAQKCYPLLFTALLPACVSGKTWPNILFIDNFTDQQILALAMAINNVYATN